MPRPTVEANATSFDSPGRRGDAAPMHRITRSVVGSTVLAVVVAACGGTPPAPELTDPIAVVEAAATQFARAEAVHVDVAVDGELAIDLMGTGGGAPIQLTDTTAAIDLDLRDGGAKATFAVPGLLGLRGELIAVDGEAFLKTTLTGAQYQRIAMGEAGEQLPDGATPDPSAIVAMVTQVREALEQPGVDPVLGQEITCGTGTCYVVTMQLTPAELAALGADVGDLPLPSDLPIPIPDLGDQTVDVELRVDKATTRLAGLVLGMAGGATGDLTAELTFTDWDEDPGIAAPPAGEVAPGG
jgi:hypothetical protein